MWAFLAISNLIYFREGGMLVREWREGIGERGAGILNFFKN